jgi:pimeloyl-ACP methyl ester carboxylesterase
MQRAALLKPVRNAALILVSAALPWAGAVAWAQAPKPAPAKPAAEAPTPVPRGRVVTMTRFVKVFSDLEYDLVDALRAGNKAALDKLITADFEQRNAASPGVPVPRDEWLKVSEMRTPGPAVITDMAVHDRGDLAIASFRLRLQDQEQFVVDVWRRKAADSYELVTRYASSKPLPAQPAVAPSAPDGKG